MKHIKWVKLALFFLIIAAGSAWPIFKIISFEFSKEAPKIYRFHSAIVDPYDPFRGRYVTLNPQPSELIIAPKDFDPKYAVLGTDEDNFATVVDLVEEPIPNQDVIKLKSVYYNYDYDKYRFRLPLERFYMNENLAPAAEQAYMKATREGLNSTCAIVVKIYPDGNYTIEDLEIDNQPIREYINSKTD